MASSAHLGIIRTDFHVVKQWDALLEGRVMYMAEADTTDFGVLTAIYRHVGKFQNRRGIQLRQLRRRPA